MSFSNWPLTSTDDPIGADAGSSPIRLASTVPASSSNTTQPDSTPSASVPTSAIGPPESVAVAPALGALLVGLLPADVLPSTDELVVDEDVGGVDGVDEHPTSAIASTPATPVRASLLGQCSDRMRSPNVVVEADRVLGPPRPLPVPGLSCLPGAR